MSLRLICLTAHPDDEAGAFGGALLIAAAHGIQTSVVCLTEGSAGSYRAPGQSDDELAALRRQEFAAACRALHVTEHALLHYPDGELWQQPFLPLVGVLTAAIRRFQPHIVLTFGAEGGVNLHRDHTTISLAATAAFHWAGRAAFFPEHLAPHPAQDNHHDLPRLTPWAPQKLYYAATPFLSNADDETQRIGTFTPPTLTYTLGPLRRQKLAAFRLHASQQAIMDRVEARFDAELDHESYHLAATRTPALPDHELWDNLTPD